MKFTNGYESLVLGSNIANIPDGKLSYLDNERKFDADSCLKYAYKDTSILKMGNDLYLDLIAIRTFRNRIVNIYLFFKKKEGYKALRTCLATYGLFNSKPNDYVDIYNWETSSINLSLQYEAKSDYGVAVFTSNGLQKEIDAMHLKALINRYYLNRP